jgi:hypothetical protein
VLEYKYEMDVSNLETNSDIYSILKTTIGNFFIDYLQLQNRVKTKVLLHNRDRSLRISHSYIFILITNHIINKTINKYIFLIYVNLSTK